MILRKTNNGSQLFILFMELIIISR